MAAQTTSSRSAWRRWTWRIAGALAALAVTVAAAYWFWPRRVWTDGGAIRVSQHDARPREVLWTPPAKISTAFAGHEQIYEPSLSPDATELYFVKGKAGKIPAAAHIYMSRRRGNGWTKAVAVDSVNSPYDDLGPRVSADGRFLFFYSNRPGGYGGYDIWAARRAPDGWGAPFNLGPGVNSEFNEYSPDPSPDGKRLIFSTNRKAARREQAEAWNATIRQNGSGDYDLWIAELDEARTIPPQCDEDPEPATRPATQAVKIPAATVPAVASTQPALPLVFINPKEIPGLNTDSVEGASCMSPAGDYLYFASNRPGGFGKFDIYRARVKNWAFGPVENLGPSINTPDNETDPFLAMGGFRLIYSSDSGGDKSRYALLTSDSREVYQESVARPLPRLGWSWWAMLLSAAVLVPLILFLRGWDSRRLNLLQKCLLVSLLIHVGATFLLTFLMVTQEVTHYVKRQIQQEVTVNLTAPRDVAVGLAIRGQYSPDVGIAAAPPGTLAASAVEIPVTALPVEISVPHARVTPGAVPMRLFVPRAPTPTVAPPREAVAVRPQAPGLDPLDVRVNMPRAVSAAEITPQTDARATALPRAANVDVISGNAQTVDVGLSPVAADPGRAGTSSMAGPGIGARVNIPGAPPAAVSPTGADVALAAPPAIAAPRITASRIAAAVDGPIAPQALSPALEKQAPPGTGQEVASPPQTVGVRPGAVERTAAIAGNNLQPAAPAVRVNGMVQSASAAPADSAAPITPIAPTIAKPAPTRQHAPEASPVAAEAAPSLTGPFAAPSAASATAAPATINLPAAPAHAGQINVGTIDAVPVTARPARAATAAPAPVAGFDVQPTVTIAKSNTLPAAATDQPRAAAEGPASAGLSKQEVAPSASTQTAGPLAVKTDLPGAQPQPGVNMTAAAIAGAEARIGDAVLRHLPATTNPASTEPTVNSKLGALATNDGAAIRHHADEPSPAAALADAPAPSGRMAVHQPGNVEHGIAAIAVGGAAAAPTTAPTQANIAPASVAAKTPFIAQPAAVAPATGSDPIVAAPAVSPTIPGPTASKARVSAAAGDDPGAIAEARVSADRQGAPMPAGVPRTVETAPAPAGAKSAAGPSMVDGVETKLRNIPPARAPFTVAAAQRDLASPTLDVSAAALPKLGAGPVKDAAGAVGPAAAEASAAAVGRVNVKLPLDRPAAVAIDIAPASPSAPAKPAKTPRGDDSLRPIPRVAPVPQLSIGPMVSASPLNGALGPGKFTAPDSPFMRAPEQRKPLVEKLGGNDESENAVAMALAYLARVQSPDGHWSVIHNDSPPKKGHHTPHDMACTGLAVLAFLAQDHTPAKDGPYRDTMSRALDFLLSNQGPDGDLRATPGLRGASSRDGNMYDHGIATLAVAEAAIMTHDQRYIDAAFKAAHFIVKAQHPAGGWRYSPGEAGDSSVFGWQIMALHSAEQLGFETPQKTKDAALRYIESCARSKRKMLAGYMPNQEPTAAMTAEILFCRMLLGQKLDDAGVSEAVDYLVKRAHDGGQHDLYYWYYASLCMMQMQDPAWKHWNTRTRDTLVRLQLRGAKAAGSWDLDFRWADNGGRVFTTAMAALTLEVYYRYMPLPK